MDDLTKALRKIVGEREARVYAALLSLGPTAIRKIADKAGINRGTTYEILKKLEQAGIVSYFHEGTRQHFVAEDPKTLLRVLARRKEELLEAERDMGTLLPRLYAAALPSENRPTVKYYSNHAGIRTILEDALDGAAKARSYAAYSSSAISPHLYHQNAWPDFTEERIRRKIFVRTIASGPGGAVYGYDERRWLTKKESAPVYKLIYGGKVAMISVGKKGIPHGLIIEDDGISQTELLIFDSLWARLGGQGRP